MKLFKHQEEFLKENPNKSSLVWSCGTGKTATAVWWARYGHGTSLIIVPKALKTNWQRESSKYGDWFTQQALYKILTKEEFRRDHKKLPKYDQVIVDEVHNGFLTPNFKSQMSKALKWYLEQHKVPRVLLLSATPYTASPWNIYSLAHYTGHHWSRPKFEHEFFYRVQMGFRSIPMVKSGSEAKLAKLVKKITSVVDIKDVIDVPLQHHTEPEYFSLSKEQEKAIAGAYDPLPIVRFTKQHQIENGILIGNEFKENQIYETDKIERLKAICEENAKVAIVCRYNAQIDVLGNELRPYKPFVIRGDIKDRDAVTTNAELSDRAVVLIQADCGIGFQLPSFEVCVYASMSYSYTSWEQMNGRFLRMDKPSRTTFIYLLTEGDSVDQGVYDAVMRKEDFKIELFKKHEN